MYYAQRRVIRASQSHRAVTIRKIKDVADIIKELGLDAITAASLFFFLFYLLPILLSGMTATNSVGVIP